MAALGTLIGPPAPLRVRGNGSRSHHALQNTALTIHRREVYRMWKWLNERELDLKESKELERHQTEPFYFWAAVMIPPVDFTFCAAV